MSIIKSIFLQLLCFVSYCSFGQFSLPSKQVIQDNNISKISITKHNLPDVLLDSTNLPKTIIEQKPYLWAMYWFNENGTPDSMKNYIEGVQFRTERYTYSKKDVLVSLQVVNQKGEETSRKTLTKLPKGKSLNKTYTKSKLKDITYCDKQGHVYLSKRYVNAAIFGYDSVVFIQRNNPFVSKETYYANGKISHELHKKWTGNPPDSFHQAFYQSSPEAGRMGSYQVSFVVNDSGTLVIPSDFPFPKMFESVTYSKRFTPCVAISDKIERLQTEDVLIKKSETIELRTPKAVLQHYFTFDYAYH